MPSLSVKDVPEPLAEKLRQRAARNHRSLQGELMAILEMAAMSETPATAVIMSSPLPSGLVARQQGQMTVEALVAHMRQQHPVPRRRAPSSVEIIRKMRDEHYGEAWVAARVKDGPWPPAPTAIDPGHGELP